MRNRTLIVALTICAIALPAAAAPPGDISCLTNLLYQHLERYTGILTKSPGVPIAIECGNTASGNTVKDLLDVWLTSHGVLLDRSGLSPRHLDLTIREAVVVIQKTGGQAHRTTKLLITSALLDENGQIISGATTFETNSDEFSAAFISSTDDSTPLMNDVSRHEINRLNTAFPVVSLLLMVGSLTYFALSH